MTPAWLDVMPAIPLARAVPVVWLDAPGERHWVTIPGAEGDNPGCATFGFLGNGRSLPEYGCTPLPTDRLRVDLDDPQGFAYALRFYASRKNQSGANQPPKHDFVWDDIVTGFVFGAEPTDADRLALAQALAEVVR